MPPNENPTGQGDPPSQIPPSSSVIAAASPGQDIDWERKFNGIRGSWNADKAAFATREGEFKQRIDGLQQQLADSQQAHSSAVAENQALAAQVGQLDELREQAGQLSVVQAREQKLQMILRYPELTGATKVVIEKDEAGNDVEVRENPYLTLAMTSTLQGPEFETMLSDLSRVVPTQETPAAPAAPAPLLGSAPAPAPQDPAATIADLRRKRGEAKDAHNYAEVTRLNDAIMAQLKP
jgi:hypothetical protein